GPRLNRIATWNAGVGEGYGLNFANSATGLKGLRSSNHLPAATRRMPNYGAVACKVSWTS
ncbi:MAG: hypothetical protein E6471_03860, partial [Bradyrhizobium sp.]|nr:hypothetical protein [Bradyrhizobium sp.]